MEKYITCITSFWQCQQRISAAKNTQIKQELSGVPIWLCTEGNDFTVWQINDTIAWWFGDHVLREYLLQSAIEKAPVTVYGVNYQPYPNAPQEFIISGTNATMHKDFKLLAGILDYLQDVEFKRPTVALTDSEHIVMAWKLKIKNAEDFHLFARITNQGLEIIIDDQRANFPKPPTYKPAKLGKKWAKIIVVCIYELIRNDIAQTPDES